MRVVAAVLPPSSLQLPGDCERPVVLVKPFPLEADGLALAGADSESQYEPDAVPAFERGLEQTVDFLDLERLDLVLLDPGRLRQRNRVTFDVPSPVCFAERCAGGSVHLVRGAGLPALADDRGVQLLEMLGFDLVHPVLAQAGNQMDVHCGAVRPVRLVLDGRSSDVLQPVRQPVLDQPCSPGLTRLPIVALALKLTDAVNRIGLFLARDMSAVGGPVVVHAHRHSAMPVAVSAKVDRRRTVRRARALRALLPRHVRPSRQIGHARTALG